MNSIPSSVEDAGAQAPISLELEAHEHAVTRIDDQIEGLVRTVRQLEFQKAQHLERIRYIKGLTTLARQLLPDLLACIIKECVLEGWTRMPLTASHVCSEWRRVLKIPTIWSHVYVNCDAKDPYRRTSFWLKNAQTSPLQIIVDVRSDASSIPAIMALLTTRAPQWQTLTIISSVFYHSNAILQLCNCPLPQLAALNIAVSEEFDDRNDLPGQHQHLKIIEVSAQAPCLRRLRIDRNTLPSLGTIPTGITDLSIFLPFVNHPSVISVDKALALFDALPALRTLSIGLPYQQARQFELAENKGRLVHLSELYTLTLTGSSQIFRILPHLVTPSLTNLLLRSSVSSLSYPDDEIGSNVQKYMAQIPPLRLLDLHDVDLPPAI
ncbi:hypothetical protein H0H93_007732 [Arthromyces matolae]|nr:hypothetical protein H0H93_007732 [Arthromyces matolae]